MSGNQRVKMYDKIIRWAVNAWLTTTGYLLITFTLGSGWLPLAFFAVVAVGFAISAIKLDERLTARMEDAQPAKWNVSVNNVHVGTVSDAEYAAMLRNAYRDPRLTLAQFFNLGRMALVVVEKLLIAVPLLVFWGAIALAIFSPESYTDMVREFQKADPVAITSAARLLLQLALTVMFVALVGMGMMGARFGFRNHYSEAVNRMLRQHCNTPANGHIQMIRDSMADQVEATRRA